MKRSVPVTRWNATPTCKQRHQGLQTQLEERAEEEASGQVRERFPADVAALDRDIRGLQHSLEQELYEDGELPARE